MKKTSYALGMTIGAQLASLNCADLDIDEFAKAIKAVLAGNQPELSATEAQTLVQEFIQAKEAEKGKGAKDAGEAFLENNKSNEGVITLPSGLQYTIINEGTGKKPKATDKVKCHYEGTLIDGTVFDSSIRRGEPATFPLNGVIKGWTEGLQLMSEGAKYRFFIPFHLAYGSQGAGGSIPPYAALIFDVELLNVL